MRDEQLLKEAVTEMMTSIRPSRAGWKREAELRLTAEVTTRLRLWREAEAEKEAQERLLPIWRLHVLRGSYSFSNCLYGAEARKGGGSMTWAEASAEAEAFCLRHRGKIRRDSEFWDAMTWECEYPPVRVRTWLGLNDAFMVLRPPIDPAK